MPGKGTRAKAAYINGVDTLKEYKQNKINIENQHKLLETQLKGIRKSENIEKEFKPQLKTIYEKLTDEKVSLKEKFELSHTIIDKIEFDKSTGTLYLSYKYQM